MRQQMMYQAIASAIQARINCDKSGNLEWHGRWSDKLDALEQELPSGAGFDAGSKILFDKCKPDRLVFSTSFHHMHESGMYDGWTEHEVWVTPAFVGKLEVVVKGRDRNGIKEYISDVFYAALVEEVNPS